jgi:hypothetical protein
MGRTPTQIVNELDERAYRTSGDVRLPYSVSLSNVKRIVSDLQREEDTSGSGPWTFLDDDTGAPSIVLETLAQVVAYTNGQKTSFDVPEARVVARIGKAFPDLPILGRWKLAVLYVVRRELGKRSDDLDQFLAFAPWRDPIAGEPMNRLAEYFRAQLLGWIPPTPLAVRPPTPHAVHSSDDFPPSKDSIGLEADAATAFQQGRKIQALVDQLSAFWRDDADVTDPGKSTGAAVSNPVSDDARPVTGRSRPNHSPTSAPQDTADGDE